MVQDIVTLVARFTSKINPFGLIWALSFLLLLPSLAQAQGVTIPNFWDPKAQLERPAAPLVSAIPEGTRLRAIHLAGAGQAFVDLSREASSAHRGGTFDEILTVYSIVNAVTENLPAIRSVQILVDGKTVDSLAGHLDLREPLVRDPAVLNSSRPR